MKTIAPRSVLLVAATIVLFPGLTFHSAHADDDDAAQRIANGFSLEDERDQRAKKRAAARNAAQLAAEKSAMEAVRREAEAAKDDAEVQAYRKELMDRVRREAAQHRKAAEALVKERRRQAEAAKKAKNKELARQQAEDREKFKKPETTRKLVVRTPKANAARANKPADKPIGNSSNLEELALEAESERLGNLEQTRNAELRDLDRKLAATAARREARKTARKAAAKKRQSDARAARLAEAKLEAQRLKRQKQIHAERMADQAARQRAERDAAHARNVAARQTTGQRTSGTQRTDPAWEQAEAARLTKEAARRFSRQLTEREARRRNSRRSRDDYARQDNYTDQNDYADRGRRGRRNQNSYRNDSPRYARRDAFDWDDSRDRPERAAPSPAPRTDLSRVAVLLIMKPGRRGIRRFNKTADPVLCTSGGCYISQGTTYPARFVSRRRALGAQNTFGRRAGACNRRLACIFRNVHLGRNSLTLQPVDLRVLHHDRRVRQVVDAPSRCNVIRGRISCTEAFNTRDYDMWVIPEELAAQAGPGALENAVRAGLPVSKPRAGFKEAGYTFHSSTNW